LKKPKSAGSKEPKKSQREYTEEEKISVIVANYLANGSSRTAAKALGISPTTVGGRLGMALQKQPDLKELRELNRKLKEGPGFEAVKRAASTLEGLKKAGLDPPQSALEGAAKLIAERPND
jgi:transposase-like protein